MLVFLVTFLFPPHRAERGEEGKGKELSLCLLFPIGAVPVPYGEVLHSFPAPGLLERRIMENTVSGRRCSVVFIF